VCVCVYVCATLLLCYCYVLLSYVICHMMLLCSYATVLLSTNSYVSYTIYHVGLIHIQLRDPHRCPLEQPGQHLEPALLGAQLLGALPTHTLIYIHIYIHTHTHTYIHTHTYTHTHIHTHTHTYTHIHTYTYRSRPLRLTRNSRVCLLRRIQYSPSSCWN
jgi:hypothetical protein